MSRQFRTLAEGGDYFEGVRWRDGTELLLAVAEGFFEAAQGVTGTAELVATTVDVPVGHN